MELFRRVVAMLLLLVGGFLFLWPGSKVFIVKVPDFDKGYQKQVKEKGPEALPFNEYIFKVSDGRRIELSGTQWEKLVSALQSPDSNTDIRSRQFGYFNDSFAFHVDEEPFLSLPPFLEFQYISVNNGSQWLAMRTDYPQDVRELPADFIHPYRTVGLSLYLAGFLVYFLVPRKNFAEGDIHYPRGSTVIAPDMLGLCLVPVFALLPFLIVWENSPGTSVLSVSTGWIWLTGALWLMATVMGMMLKVGYQYSSLSYRLAEDGLYEVYGGRTTLWQWDEMDFFQSYENRTSSKIARLLILFGGSFQSAGLGIAMDGNNEFGINVTDRNGNRLKIMSNALAQFDDIVSALKAHGVKRKRKTNNR